MKTYKDTFNSWKVCLIWIFILLTLMPVVDSKNYQFLNNSILNFTRYFQVEKEVKEMYEYSELLEFNSTKQKYVFIYYPLMAKCVDQVKQEYEKIKSAFTNSGVGATVYGIIASATTAFKGGMFKKIGLSGLFKAAGLSVLSFGSLPIFAGIGIASYLYNDYLSEETKQTCNIALKEINNLILKTQLKQLNHIKNQLKENGKALKKRIKFIRNFPHIHDNYLIDRKKLILKGQMLKNFIKYFIKFT